MDLNNFYSLLQVSCDASVIQIHTRCVEMMKKWTTLNIQKKLPMNPIESVTYAPSIHKHGVYYLSMIASILLDPTSRECYDLWLEACVNPDKQALSNAQIQWFNANARRTPLRFGSDTTFETTQSFQNCNLQPLPSLPSLPSLPIVAPCLNCRFCSLPFEQFKVLQCGCTSRIGHLQCVRTFSNKWSGKCPVCRTNLVTRSEISKYLFWNKKRKWKLVT